MAKTGDAGRGLTLDRCYRLAALLIDGEVLDRERVVSALGLGKANADRHLRAIEKHIPVSRLAERGGRTRLRLGKASQRPTSTNTVVAACFAAMLSRLFTDTPFESRLLGLVDHILENVREQPKYCHRDRQFWFVARGGERAVRKDRGDLLATLIDAILSCQWVLVTKTKFDGTSYRARLKPLSLVLHEHQLYLLGMDERGELDNIRFARITKISIRKERFEYPTLDEFDPKLVFRDSFGIFIHNNSSSQISVERIRIRLDKRWRSYVETHRWHESQKHKRDGESLILELQVRTCPEVQAFILGFGEDAEVLEPLWLRKKIADRLTQMAKRYAS